MKFRIVTNGEKYRIQEKFIIWVNLYKRENIEICDTEKDHFVLAPIEFEKPDEAIKYIKEEYGNRSKIVKKNNNWRTY